MWTRRCRRTWRTRASWPATTRAFSPSPRVPASRARPWRCPSASPACPNRYRPVDSSRAASVSRSPPRVAAAREASTRGSAGCSSARVWHVAPHPSRRLGWGEEGGRSGGRRGDRLDPIGQNYLGGAGVDDRVSADGCGRGRTYRRRVGRYFTDRPGPRPARRRRTLPRHHSLDPCSSTEWEGFGFPTRTRFSLAPGNEPLGTLQRTARLLREENFERKDLRKRAKPRRAIYF